MASNDVKFSTNYSVLFLYAKYSINFNTLKFSTSPKFKILPHDD